MYPWNHLVSVRAGSSATTVEPFCASSYAFLTQSTIALPYGGFIQQISSPQSCNSPFSFFVKNLRHLAFSFVAQTSRVKWNSLSSFSKKSFGVDHSSVPLLNIALLLNTSFLQFPDNLFSVKFADFQLFASLVNLNYALRKIPICVVHLSLLSIMR